MNELFLKVVNMSISASWIVLAVLLLRLLLKKAPKWINVILWGIVGIRLVCPFNVESIFSLVPSNETIPTDIISTQNTNINSGISFVDTAVNGYISDLYAGGATIDYRKIVITVISVIWLVGIAVMLTYTLISYIRIKNKLKEAVLKTENVLLCDRISTPFILGIVKPKIYLPFNLSEKDSEFVIAHEKSHIRRKDHIWKPLGFLILALHWFNPLIWPVYVLFCRDIELACDEKVIKEFNTDKRADYSQALLTCSIDRRMISVCPLAFGEVGIKERIKTVLNYKKPAFWIVIVGVVACVAVSVCFLTNAPKRQDVVSHLNMDSLREKYPDYFGLNEEDGLTVYVWQMSEDNYYCHLVNTVQNDISDNKFTFSEGATLKEMRAILTTYNIDKKDINVKPVINLISSYYYKIDDAYTDKINKLFWEETPDFEEDSKDNISDGYNPYFNATVLEVYENSVLVEPFEGSNEHKSADKITVNTNVVSTHPVPELKKGMQIRIVYNGTIEETYPANIPTSFAIYELREVDGKLEPVIATPLKNGQDNNEVSSATNYRHKSLINSDVNEIYVLSKTSKGQMHKFPVSKTYTDNKTEQLKAFLNTEYCKQKEADNWVKLNPAKANEKYLALVLSDGGTMIINIHFTESSPVYYIAIATAKESFDPEKDYSNIEYTRYVAKAEFGEFLKSII